jgi:hypothetical protein
VQERSKLQYYWGGTALLRAAHLGDMDRVEMLLARNAKVNSATSTHAFLCLFVWKCTI